MSTVTAPSTIVCPVAKKTKNLAAKVVLFTALLGVALSFVGKYVFRYYLHYNEAAFTDPAQGAANYWAMRGWLLAHMTGGMVALLIGPWQFWTGFRTKFARLHRWMGRLFLCGVALGSLGALRLIIGTTFGWAFGFSLFGLVLAWLSTAGMAYYAIDNKRKCRGPQGMDDSRLRSDVFVCDLPRIQRLRANVTASTGW